MFPTRLVSEFCIPKKINIGGRILNKKNNKKILDRIGITIVVLLFVESFAVAISLSPSKKGVLLEDGLYLLIYRLETIPEDCRLPVYDNDIVSWREHLRHHSDTMYCLDYPE